MPARLDPFVEVMLRERADQLYLLPDEPVTLVKDGKPRKVSKQPLTDQHIYALMVEVAPPEAADKIDQHSETEFDYAAGNGLVRVRIVPEGGRLTAVISAIRRASQEQAAPAVPPPSSPPSGAPAEVTAVRPAPPAKPAAPAKAPRASVIAAAPMVESPAPEMPAAPSALPGEFASSQYEAAEQKLGKLLRALVSSGSSDLHLRVGEPPLFRTHGDIKRQPGGGAALSVNDLELLVLSIMPERNRGEWKETGDTDFAYEISGLARFRVNAARDRKGPVAVFRVIPAKVVTVEEMGLTDEVQKLCYLTKGLVLVTGPTGSGKSTTLCALIDLVNRTRTDHIITIEDPIEFVHENKKCLITQRQVHVHTESFRTALRARDGRNRASRLRHAAHHHGRVDRGPHHRSVSRGSSGADPGNAIGIAERRDFADAVQEDRWGAGGGTRDPAQHPGHREPDSRGQDVPDSVDHSNQQEAGDADAERRAPRARRKEGDRA